MRMGVSYAALLNHGTNEIKVFTEHDINSVIDELFSSDLVVGVNLKKFNYEVLSGYNKADFEKIRSLDILDDVRKKIVLKPSLDDLFLGTLGIKKSIDNMRMARLFKRGKRETVKEIVIENAKALNSVYSFGKQRGHVYLNDRPGQRWKISVSW